MRTIINNQKKERDTLLSRPYLTRHTQYDAGELKCSNLTIVTMNEERVIEKNGYKVKVLPIYKF
jgi:ribosomal protein S1